jgi:hypothetical protein
MLVRHAFTLNLTLEQMKAWSQNLGHADVLTTFTSYGQLPTHRQGELIRALSAPPLDSDVARSEQVAALESLLAHIKGTSPILPGAAAGR